MKPETIKQLLDHGMNSSQLVEALNHDVMIRQLRQIEEDKYEQLNKKFIEDRKQIQERIKGIQRECQHYETTYYPDASGNNDSCYCCAACKSEMKHPPDRTKPLIVN